MLGSPILYLKGMRILMFKPSGFYYKPNTFTETPKLQTPSPQPKPPAPRRESRNPVRSDQGGIWRMRMKTARRRFGVESSGVRV